MKNKWTEENLKKAIQANITIAGVLKMLGLSRSPQHYRVFHLKIRDYGLSTSHFKGKAVGGGKSPQPLEKLLTKKSPYIQSNRLRRRLIKESLPREQCTSCGLGPEWNGQPLTLQLDHINGEPSDNRLTNLRLLCPNCHSQTATFCLSGTRYSKPLNICKDCGAYIGRRSTRCPSCNRGHRPQKIEWPPAPELAQRVQESSYVAVAKELGVSDNAIRKYLRRKIGHAPKKYKTSTN